MKNLARLAALAGLLLPVAAFAGPQNPGKWEIKVEMTGMPMKVPPQTFTQCITKEQADNPEPPKMKADSDCKVLDYKLDGKTVSWKMKCEKQQLTGDGRMTFAGDTYEGVLHMKFGENEMTQKYTAKRLGDCDAKK